MGFGFGLKEEGEERWGNGGAGAGAFCYEGAAAATGRWAQKRGRAMAQGSAREEMGRKGGAAARNYPSVQFVPLK